MADVYKVSLAQLIDELKLEVLYSPGDLDKIYIYNNDINRPALQLTGFYEYFNTEKVQACGNTELAYLKGLSPEDRAKSLDKLFSYKFPALIICQNHDAFPEMLEGAKK